jgi:alpha/beta superfamily hydrolase
MGPLRFQTSDGLTLEGEIRHADGQARATAVLCHPLPIHGGSKDHPLLWAIRNDLAAKRGVTVLAFNFRGVMGSEGEFGRGQAESADVAAAVDAVLAEGPPPVVLVGWSFGSIVALRHALEDPRAGALVLIGYPLGEPRFGLPPPPDREELSGLDIPVLLVSGAADQFSPAPEVRAVSRKLPQGRAEIIPDSGHFFERREREVAELVGGFVDDVLSGQ